MKQQYQIYKITHRGHELAATVQSGSASQAFCDFVRTDLDVTVHHLRPVLMERFASRHFMVKDESGKRMYFLV